MYKAGRRERKKARCCNSNLNSRRPCRRQAELGPGTKRLPRRQDDLVVAEQRQLSITGTV